MLPILPRELILTRLAIPVQVHVSSQVERAVTHSAADRVVDDVFLKVLVRVSTFLLAATHTRRGNNGDGTSLF